MFSNRTNILSFLLACFLIIGSSELFAQHQGIGLRIGEPFAVTYKKYLPANRALEFNLGTAMKNWSRNYYKNSFEERYEDEGYAEVNHDVTSVVYLQGRYLFHNAINAEGIEGKFTWYYGAGLLMKTARVEYRYHDPATGKEIHEKKLNDFDFGPEGAIGVEYTFEDAPISVFGELNLLLELTDRTAVRLLGGVGARFNF